MFNQFAHAGHDHAEEPSSETKNEQSYQTVAAESKTHPTPESSFSYAPFIAGGVLVVILTGAILGATYLSSKKKDTLPKSDTGTN